MLRKLRFRQKKWFSYKKTCKGEFLLLLVRRILHKNKFYLNSGWTRMILCGEYFQRC